MLAIQTVCYVDIQGVVSYDVTAGSGGTEFDVENQDHFYEEVGRRIRDARNRRKPPLTQEALAKMVSLTRTSITNVEKGRQKLLLHTLAAIATALQVEPATLLPHPNLESERQLEDALKNRPRSEKEWIKSAVSAAKKE